MKQLVMRSYSFFTVTILLGVLLFVAATAAGVNVFGK
jgi:hypothetical protein